MIPRGGIERGGGGGSGEMVGEAGSGRSWLGSRAVAKVEERGGGSRRYELGGKGRSGGGDWGWGLACEGIRVTNTEWSDSVPSRSDVARWSHLCLPEWSDSRRETADVASQERDVGSRED